MRRLSPDLLKRWIDVGSCLTLSAVLLSLVGCGGGAKASPPLSVSISGTSQTIGQGQSTTISAMVANDSSGRGVTWALGGVGALSKQSSTSVEYGAPAAVTSKATSTVTATAVADPSKSAVYTVNLAVIAVSVSPASTDVAVNVTQSFTATVQYDGSNGGVTWSLTQGGTPCSPACGSVTPSNTPSGASTTYTPPVAVPANASVTLTATSMADTTRSSAAAITIAPALPISVSVSPDSANVPAQTGTGFTATVLYDASNAGVNWSLTQAGTACSPGCGTVSPPSTANGDTTTYTGPDAVPANSAVTLTATSVTDPTKSASATITVLPPPIYVSVQPGSVLMGVNSTQQFTATIRNDRGNKGVSWSLTESGSSCSPSCGTVAPPSTTSGETTTYTAPSTAQANKVTLTATSVADKTSSNCPDSAALGCVAITVTNGTVKLVPASINFGRVTIGTTAQAQVALTNTGTGVLTLTSITTTKTVFSETNDCGGSVASGGNCTITVGFQPNNSNLQVADLVVTDSSADSPQQVRLQGKGKSGPTAAMQAALASSTAAGVPRPTGPTAVGTRVMRLVDPLRADPYTHNTKMREVLVRFWYPASLNHGCVPAEYTSPRVWRYFSELAGFHLPEVSTNSCLDAPVTNGRHPIVVFTHGYTGTFTDYTFLFEDLASRGYVVASVDHTYEAAAVEFPDGRFVESIHGSHFGNIEGNDEHELAFAVEVRRGDLKFVANQLRLLNLDYGSPFAGRLDTARMAIAGHSLGGLTALLELEQEPSFRAAVILDGVVPQNPIDATKKPVLILTAGKNSWASSEQDLWRELHGPRFLVNLRGAEHLTPTDLIWLAKGAIKTGTMGPEKTIAAIREYIAAFLDANLRGQRAVPLFGGTSGEFPDVEVTSPLRSQRAGSEEE
jgi:dienelactone hydrolase